MPARFLLLPEVSPAEALARRMAALSRSRSVMIVSARLPLATLREHLGQAGAKLEHVFIMDVASDYLSAQVGDPEHEASVPNPGMLELIAARAQRIVREKAERDATVIVDDVNTFAAYNDREALAQIVTYAATQLLSANNDLEYAVAPGLDEDVWNFLRPHLDEVRDLEEDGALVPAS